MKRIQWPTAIVMIVALLILGAAYLAGPSLGVPAESHVQLMSALSGFFMLVLGVMRSVFTKDSDGDGLPDALDRPTPEPSAAFDDGGGL